MREIEFRGKLKSNINEHKPAGSWVYGGYMKNRYHDTTAIWAERDDGTSYGHEIIPETVGQYTGCKDRKGAKIFGGDILRENDGFFVDHITFVRWDDEHCGFVCCHTTSEYAPHKGVVIVSLYHFCSANHEIIGNQFDNPELLAGNKEKP